MRNDIETYILIKATEMSFGDPDLAEDLAQEARIAIFKLLQRNPAEPYSHQVNKVKQAIWHYRVRGKSVDGKLNPRGRKRQYQVLSGNLPILDQRRQSPTRPTENKALSSIFISQRYRWLRPIERHVIRLRVQGYSWLAIRLALHISPQYVMQRIFETFQGETNYGT